MSENGLQMSISSSKPKMTSSELLLCLYKTQKRKDAHIGDAVTGERLEMFVFFTEMIHVIGSLSPKPGDLK